MKLAVAALAVAAVSLGGCVIYTNQGGEDVSVHVGSSRTSAASPVAEAVGAVRFDGSAMHVRVGSNGCTDASSFEVEIAGSEPATVQLTRARPDLCKALVADGVEVTWTYEDLGLAPGSAVQLLNPITL